MTKIVQDERIESLHGPQYLFRKKNLFNLKFLRLLCVFVLFTFIFGHLSNLTLGVVSLELEDWFLPYALIWPWYTIVGGYFLGFTFVLHFFLVLLQLYQHRSWRITRWEAVRIGCGLLIPFLFVGHVIDIQSVYGMGEGIPNYVNILNLYWRVIPEKGFVQVLGLLVVWVHVCLEGYDVLRVRPRLLFFKSFIGIFVVLVPSLAISGFMSSAMEIRGVTQNETVLESAEELLEETGYTVVLHGRTKEYAFFIRMVLLSCILGVFVFQGLRSAWQHRRRLPRVSYKDLHEFEVLPGSTLLAAIRQAQIPHASVCGGNGRCSTCRVRISEGLKFLPPPGPTEHRILQKINAPSAVRLACQIRPTFDLKVIPLLPPTVSAKDGLKASSYLQGEEREIAILFADLRGFTRLSDAQLPYDVVFLLNQYFAEMGQAVTNAGGHLDKFIGDGVMALFGIESGPEEGSSTAVMAASMMLDGLDILNKTLGSQLTEPLRMGIGIHVGTVIVGEMGYGSAKNLTAIGDAVNLASRLEGLTKEYQVAVVISDDVAVRCGGNFCGFPRAETPIRGKKEHLNVLPLSGTELKQALRSSPIIS